jgi:hypothetical protein
MAAMPLVTTALVPAPANWLDVTVGGRDERRSQLSVGILALDTNNRIVGNPVPLRCFTSIIVRPLPSSINVIAIDFGDTAFN